MGKERLQKLNWMFMAMSFLGFLDALYLSIERLKGEKVICIILEGCDRVSTSPYSLMLNIPVAYLGVAYYVFVFLLGTWFMLSKKEEVIRAMSYLTPAGFLASTWFVYLQIYVIRAICIYCMVSATTSTALFVVGSYYLVNHHRRKRTP